MNLHKTPKELETQSPLQIGQSPGPWGQWSPPQFAVQRSEYMPSGTWMLAPATSLRPNDLAASLGGHSRFVLSRPEEVKTMSEEEAKQQEQA